MKRESGLNELANILRLLVSGLNKKQVREKLNLSRSNFANYLGKLEKRGNIKRVGKYEVQILASSLTNPRVTTNLIEKQMNKRGHAFNFKIVFQGETNLLENKIIKGLVESNKAEVLSFGSIKFREDKNTIWINKGSITIYSNNSYYSEDANHTKFKALQDIDQLVRDLKYRFQLKGIYGIEIFREHYGLIFNQFAEWILSQNKKFKLENNKNKTIFWVDDSMKDDVGLKEFEGNSPGKINKAAKLFESHERTNWDVTPEFILDSFKQSAEATQKNAEQLNYFGENMVSHVKAIQRISAGLQQQTKLFEEIRDFLKSKQ